MQELLSEEPRPGSAAEQLAVHLGRLEALLRERHPTLTWSHIGLVDEIDPQHRTELNSPREDPEAFAGTWARLVEGTCSDWINLHAVGLDDDMLLVAVERRPLTNGTRTPPDRISVNLSGPEGLSR